VEVSVDDRWGSRIVRRDQVALDRLAQWFEAEHRSLLRLAVLLTNDHAAAEDLVQETFIRMHKVSEGIDAAGFRAYARRTLVNLSRSRFRKGARERRAVHASYKSGVVDAPDISQRDELWRRVSRLTSTQRACIVLRFYEDLPDGEIAEVLGTSVGSVRQQIHKGMARLKAELGEQT
jgi:RNA polymerase sigma-70 factor (sigma-E family)